MEKLKKLYYSTDGYQMGKTAANKIKVKIPELTVKQIQQWLDRQPIYQIYKKSPKTVKYPHYTLDIPNHTHQVDILYLPHDIVKGVKYKYCLSIIDIASRFKGGKPLKTKTAAEVSRAIEDVYDNTPLNYPKVIMCDVGTEFRGEFTRLMESHDTKINRSLNKKKVAFVERFNRTLSQKLFAHQYAEEMKTDETNREWVKRLQGVIDALNNEKTRMIEMKPVDAIELKSVPQPEYPDDFTEEKIDIDLLVRYLYKPGEEQGDNRYRATDPIWSVDVYKIDEIKEFENQPALYTLQDIENRTFTQQQLQVVPDNTDFDNK